jgi:hypothetical protein
MNLKQLLTLPLAASLALSLSGTALSAARGPHPRLAKVDHTALHSVETITRWNEERDTWGPTYTASPGWLKFTEFVKAQLAADGITNVTQYDFPYQRWYTTEYPDKSGWSFVSDGKAVDVASYATQSGTTGPEGVTAPLILYDLSIPVALRPTLEQLRGKIVVVKQQPFATLGSPARPPLGVAAPTTETPAPVCGNPPRCMPQQAGGVTASVNWGRAGNQGTPFAGVIGFNDYEYQSNPETFNWAMGVKTPLELESSPRNRDQFSQIGPVITNVLIPSGAVAAIQVTDLSPAAAQGQRQHPTPRQYQVPMLILDRKAGAQVLLDAINGKTGTLKLVAHQEMNAKAFELVAVLPGRDHGTAKDQAIMLSTHMDGPSIVEDNGAMGMVAVLHYYAQIPQRDRPKTLVAFFDTRHFVPGTEGGYPYDAVEHHPELFRNVVGGVAMEHWGGAQYIEVGDDYRPSGHASTTYIWGWPNQIAIDAATNAIKEQGLPRAVNSVSARPGVHGLPQQEWRGNGFSAYLVEFGGWPGWHVSGDWPSAGFQAYYPSAKTRIMPDLFYRQAATSVQLINTLMTGDVIAMAPDWGYLRTAIHTAADTDITAPGGKAALLAAFDTMFEKVKAGDYRGVEAPLAALTAQVRTGMSGKPQTDALMRAEKCVAWTKRALDWKRRGLL